MENNYKEEISTLNYALEEANGSKNAIISKLNESMEEIEKFKKVIIMQKQAQAKLEQNHSTEVSIYKNLEKKTKRIY